MRVEEALAVRALQVAHPVVLAHGLDALGDRLDPSERAIATIAAASADGAMRLLGVLVGELARDLEGVDRELAEVAEREVAGPEVVDHHPHAEVAQALEGRDRRRAWPAAAPSR